ncbi:ABC transporter permease [Actinotignum sanguinis]|uniref:ABC transporter permease n=2 Tax=Actinomycetaceae TaxID=2049 RepID=A0ABZ0RCD9_9ACTO|nr:ABC transporter permease [Actinotignum sanguinis]MDK6787974.1 ABC transporter permease [Actinotignum timonense]WPJ88888.1 ABC transporter permease [Schaalia turicensis]MDE1656091.1 ABC transporter permease [Actinotignum sanguinis]MDK7198216.1 ABC transporter permease [Actinotignum sanguinis]MDK8512991.1 ABC transporter permease [Actinotignum sanguinis]
MNNLLRLIGRRLLVLPIMVLGVAFLVFFLMSFSKIDPAYSALGEGASQEALEAYRNTMGLNDPWLAQFWNFLVNFVQGDLGTYGANQASVAERVGEAFPITMQLTFLGLIIAVVLAFVFGVLAALYRDKWPDKIIRVFSIAFIATPSFWLAVLMILAFSVNMPLLPASGALPAFGEDPAGWLARMALPAIALGVPVAGSLTRVIRTSMVEELDKDYVRTAIGAGIPKRVVVSRNVLRNALISPVTVLGLRIGYLMGGAVVIEVIFNLRGMGMAILEGVQQNYPLLVQGVVLVVALAFIVVNIVVDMLYVLINPRIREV